MGEEISVSQLLDVPPEKLKGLVSVRGTGASHVALLARGTGDSGGVRRQQPAAGPAERSRSRGGWLYHAGLHPAQPGLAPGISEADRRRGRAVARFAAPARSAGGNPGRAAAGTARQFRAVRRHRRRPQQRGAGGGAVPLGTALFLRDRFPGEEEQTNLYNRVLRIMDPHPVVLRTLDIGGDKPLPYFPIIEQNPFLGWRGIRISLDQPDLFKTQLRAMLRAGAIIPIWRFCFR
jgi:phosphotransferase system enzyme I (PtsP)